MSNIKYFLSLALVFILMFLATPKTLFFYDAPEYLRVVSENSFLQALPLDHQPIHPVFIGTLWVSSHLINLLTGNMVYSLNLSAYFFGVLSIILFYKLAKKFLRGSLPILATLVFSLFPAVWIINTNLMVESLLLTLFLFSSLCLIKVIEKSVESSRSAMKEANTWKVAKWNAVKHLTPSRWKVLYVLSIVFLIVSHVQTIFWLPAVFSLIYFFKIKHLRGDKLKRSAGYSSSDGGILRIIYFTFFFAILKINSDLEVIMRRWRNQEGEGAEEE